MSDKHLCQVGLCCHNSSQLRAWYHDAFGMPYAGGIVGLPVPPENSTALILLTIFSYP